jgi:hypothetical protein
MNTFSFSFIVAGLICVANIICMKMCVVHSPVAEATFGFVWVVTMLTIFALGVIFSLQTV